MYVSTRNVIELNNVVVGLMFLWLQLLVGRLFQWNIKFQKIFFIRYPTLHYSFFNIDKHIQWMDSLLEMAPSAKLSEDEEEAGPSSCTPDYTGYVLALNGHKKYFCLFRPTLTKDEDDTVQLHHKLDRLNLWMEKLTEGTLPRHYVPAWPNLHKP